MSKEAKEENYIHVEAWNARGETTLSALRNNPHHKMGFASDERDIIFEANVPEITGDTLLSVADFAEKALKNLEKEMQDEAESPDKVKRLAARYLVAYVDRDWDLTKDIEKEASKMGWKFEMLKYQLNWRPL
jgi:hypothetical protein